MNNAPVLLDAHEKRVGAIFAEHFRAVAKRADQLFSIMLLMQWIGGISLALWISPSFWAGSQSVAHFHVFTAVFLGGLLAVFPAYQGLVNPGATVNRYLNAVAQLSFSILFIHLTGGRIETHFHIFGSLAFLAFYRDWKILLLATAVISSDHVVRGLFWPESIYGVPFAGLWRALEHTFWILFEDIVLFNMIQNGLSELRSASEKQAVLEETIASVEDQVNERTMKLMDSERKVVEQHQALLVAGKMSALGEMAGGVAHEINNPLAIITAVSSQLDEMMREKELDRELVAKMSCTISNTAVRIAKIVAGLRTFSRDGNRDPFLPVKIHTLVENTVGLCAERLKSHNVKLEVGEIPPDLEFEGRETQISQVLLNLLNNSYDAVCGKEEKWVKVLVVDSGDYVCISVMDSGKGVMPEIRKKIFQPFFTTKEVGKGTGMGLSISHGLVKAHRGSLTLDEQSPNTRFVIKLPKMHRKEAPVAA